jgi:threonine dehydratase
MPGVHPVASVSLSIEDKGANVWDGPVPTLADVFRAQARIRPYLQPTPVLRSEPLSDLLGCDVILKLELLNPTGAFKVRGGINFLSQLSEEQRARGVVAASTGNHGQSIAYAARLFGTKATIFVPEQANPLKLAAMQRLGATIVATGRDFDECMEASFAFAKEQGSFLVHSANEPDLIAGVGTYSLELMQYEPNIDTFIVPIGGGSGLCGATIVAKSIDPSIEVIGVQAEGAPAVYNAWRSRELRGIERADTFAEGIATRVPFALPARILWDRVDDIALVSDRDLKRAMLTYLERSRLQVEGAGAAPLAAAWNRRHDLKGKTVALVVSGGNVPLTNLAAVLQEEKPL